MQGSCDSTDEVVLDLEAVGDERQAEDFGGAGSTRERGVG